MSLNTATNRDYRHILQALLPSGAAWPTGPGSTLGKLLEAMAAEMARLHNRAGALLEESDPRTATEMLVDWERVLGLPDDCTAELDLLLQERRAAAHAKLTLRGGQSRAFFVELAARLGFGITITEFRPFQAGRSRAGDPCYDETWRFRWQVNAPQTTVRQFRTGASTAGEPLAHWGNRMLECVLASRKPAHTAITHAYGD